MNIIPIILTFDGNMSLPSAVCISSLLMSADKDTFYDIFVLHSDEEPEITGLDKIKAQFSNFRVQYRSVGDAFRGSYEIRGITYAAYYRLLAPELIPEYDKAVYFDVDMIFRTDLTDLYSIDLGDNYLGAVLATSFNYEPSAMKYAESVGACPGSYFLSGFLLMNLAKLREDNIVPKFKALSAMKYKYQDMDIMNIVCKGRIKALPCSMSMTVGAFYMMETDPDFFNGTYSNVSEDEARNRSNIHYNGPKPWNELCPNFDIWWEYYRKSPIYDSKYYLAFFYNKLNYLDQLSLKKRIKILVRYFKDGRKKPGITL